jgi:N-methylhydantoinase B
MQEGNAVGIPRHPTSCSVATSNLADRVANAAQRAFAELGDGFGMAEAGAIIPPADGVISGTDARNGRPYVNQIFLGITGGPATPKHDGWLTLAHVGNAGMSHQDSIELAEQYQPIVVWKKHLVADSEGAGRRRGAPSCLVEFSPTHEPFDIAYICDGMTNAALGTRGGGMGGAAIAFKRSADGSSTALPAVAQVRVQKGETIVSVTPGGGGYGSPWEREIELVSEDVAEGLISRERAMNVYGVVLDAQGVPDLEASERKRSTLSIQQGFL